jgi:rubrerythrin
VKILRSGYDDPDLQVSDIAETLHKTYQAVAQKASNLGITKTRKDRTEDDELIQAACLHAWTPTFQGGDTYRCKKCGKEIDMTEDDEP